MIKKIIFVIFILSLPIVFAETKIFSGSVITDTDKVIDDGIFRFRYDETANKVFAQTPTTNLIVDNGACKSNVVFKVCINRANFSYRNITTYQSYYEVNVDIYKLTGSLTVASKSNLETLLPNEPTEFSITITNPTDFDVTSIRFNQDFTPFSLMEVKGCAVNGNSMEWQGSLQPKYDRVCTAKILADNQGAYNLIGNLSYFNSYETEKKTTDTVKITVLPRQLKIIRAFDSYTEIKQPFYLNVSLQNTNLKEKIQGSLTYEFPGNIAIIKSPSGFTKDFNIVRRSLLLDEGATLNFSFYLEPVSEGKYPIKEKYAYTIKNVYDLFENSTYINPIEPKPAIDLIAEYPEVRPGQKFIVFVKLNNPSRIYDLTNIKSRLNVPFNKEIIQNLAKLAPNQSYTIISNIFIAPEHLDPQKTTLDLELVVEYYIKDIPKSINKSLALKIGQTAGIATPVNQSQVSITDAQIQQPLQQPAENQPQQTPEKQTQIIEEKLPAKKFKIDFSNKKLRLFVGFIFVFIFIVPVVVYYIKKGKKPPIQQQTTLQKQQIQAPNQPKDF